MVFFPVRYNLYASDGITFVYQFTYVQSDNSPQDAMDYAEIQGLRGVGSIIIPGSIEAWDLKLEFILNGVDYSDLIAKMDLLQSTIVLQTKYVLKIDRTPSSTQNYNVMRLKTIEFKDLDFRTNFQNCLITFRVNSW